jgi:hypothetical protein
MPQEVRQDVPLGAVSKIPRLTVDRGQRNPRIEASVGLPRNAGYDKSAEYSIERSLHLSVEHRIFH